MSDRCTTCVKYRYQLSNAGADLSNAASKASRTWERDGQPSTKQMTELAMLRRNKAKAANTLADHEELCTFVPMSR